MARGGKREGAGRKPGQKSAKTIEREQLSAEALAEGLTPLQVMLDAMREAFEEGDKRTAAMFAKDAAPYIHPKLANINHGGQENNPIKTRMEIVIVEPDGSRKSL